MSKIIVITPTYNEAGNIEELIRRIADLRIPDLLHLVVDDSSPDGTASIVKSLIDKFPVELFERDSKQGLGKAYISAFRYVLGMSEKPTHIIQMDADLSHNPADITRLIEAGKKVDLVIGSRYIKGGMIENWDFFRRMISYWSNVFVRMILDIPVHDLTGGYKCWRAEVLEKMDLDSLSSTHYNFQIETTYTAHKLGYSIAEVPISFTERTKGKSKFNVWIMLESFYRVFALRWRS